ncbi:uncharacterized protein [Rutidosis leptorrhynchoides]|uniref:uncharacterized protein n=1 Tax=Rutidosis leptorrhynchoides TaxID=125765 RepID=UPI003A98FE75
MDPDFDDSVFMILKLFSTGTVEAVYPRNLGALCFGLTRRSFEDDLIPIKLKRFDVVFGEDWLSKNGGGIVCLGKPIHIPQVDGEPLMIFRDKKYKQLNLIWCSKDQKYLRKGCNIILAHVSKPDLEERRLDDVVVVRNFPEVFSEDLPGLMPHRAVEFQIDLVPGADLVARAPYRLTPSKL